MESICSSYAIHSRTFPLISDRDRSRLFHGTALTNIVKCNHLRKIRSPLYFPIYYVFLMVRLTVSYLSDTDIPDLMRNPICLQSNIVDSSLEQSIYLENLLLHEIFSCVKKIFFKLLSFFVYYHC